MMYRRATPYRIEIRTSADDLQSIAILRTEWRDPA
jgi:hypothetical protein